MKRNTLKMLILATSLSIVVSACASQDDTATGNTGNTTTSQNQGQPPANGGPGGGPGGGGPGGNVDTTTGRITDVAALIKTSPTNTSVSGKTVEEKVVALTEAFIKTLTPEQQKAVQLDLTAENAAQWSNLPTTMVERNGLMLGRLSKESVEAFKNLAFVALGEEGYKTFTQLMLGDEYLTTNTGNTMWDADLYYVAFLGKPSTTSKWMLQIGGHHFASNITYNGQSTSATPMFVGVEPQTFETDGVTYSPLKNRHDAVYAMINSLNADQQSQAKISSKFDDVLVGPGKDGQFPSKSEGILYSALNDSQKQTVKKAIEAWVKDTNADISQELLASYLSDDALNKTYIGWSGSTSDKDNGSYIRIDGPRVWIEFVCQNGVGFKDQIHFHTIWRDKQTDYSGSLSS